MKILIVSQYYSPEPGATSNRLESFAHAMEKRGHEVTVICEFPNHPQGILREGDRCRLFRREKISDRCMIIRTFVLTFPRKNNIKRMIFYLSFALSSFIMSLFSGRYDIIFTSSPPIFHAYSALIAAKLKRTRLVLDIRDLWPDSAVEVEAVANPRLLKMGSYLERKLYLGAEAIFTVSCGLKKVIESRGGMAKTQVVYNGTKEQILAWNGSTEGLKSTAGWTGKFNVVYAGLMGLGQGIAELFDEIAGCGHDDLNFVFIGDGPEKQSLVDRSKRQNLKNIQFIDHMPLSDVIPYMYKADVLLVVLKEKELFKSAIPSKFFDCMAAGKPILSNVDGELRTFMEEHNTGYYFSLANRGDFIAKVENLKADAELRRIMAQNGRKLVEERFLRSRLADDAAAQIEKLVK